MYTLIKCTVRKGLRVWWCQGDIIKTIDFISSLKQFGQNDIALLESATSFIAVGRLAFFYKLKVYGNPTSSKSVGTIFPKAFVHIMYLCHI